VHIKSYAPETIRGGVRTTAVVIVLSAFTPAVAPAQSLDSGSGRILKAMSDYVAAQKTISFAYDTSVEVITTQLEKIQFTSSGTVLVSRPGNIRATRTGGYADVELVSDGKTVTIYGKNIQAFAQADAPATIEELVAHIRDDLGLTLPAADLLTEHGFDNLTADVTEGRHIGRGVVDGVECEHLAFRTPETDWQIWIAASGPPVPHKFVITSKSVAGAPQYTLLIKDWRTDTPVAADAFRFKEPGGTKKVAAGDMKQLDEVPAGQGARTMGAR
jgi:hypothetical protein